VFDPGFIETEEVRVMRVNEIRYCCRVARVSIEGNNCTALNDSDCQIPIVSNRFFGRCADGAVGRVNLHGSGGKVV